MPLEPTVAIADLLASESDEKIAAITGLTFDEIIGLRAMKAAGALRSDPHWLQAVSQLRQLSRPSVRSDASKTFRSQSLL